MKKLLLVCFVVSFCCCLIFYSRNKPYIIPITLSASSIPQAKVDIQGHSYMLDIDLGSKHQLILKKEVLDLMKKDSCGSVQSRNFKGERWEFPTYRLQDIKLAKLKFKDVVAVEKTDECFQSQMVSWPAEDRKEDLAQIKGVIGRPLLEKSNLLFDVANGVLVSCHKKAGLKQLGYALESFTKVPFFKGRVYPIIEVETEIGLVRLALDTGCTFSSLRTSRIDKELVETSKSSYAFPLFFTHHLKIGNTDFGGLEFDLIDITPELTELDGVLGMDFIKEHLLYIDQKEQAVYIKK